MAIKTVYVSSDLFQGFSRTINTISFSSMKELCEYMSRQLECYLEQENLEILSKKAKNLKLHSHSYKFYSEMCDDPCDYLYLCNHC